MLGYQEKASLMEYLGSRLKGVCLNLLNAAKLNCIWGDLHLGKAEGLNF